MSDLISDDELDDLSWNPDLQKIYNDDSWGTGDIEIDQKADDTAWKIAFDINMVNYPKLLLEQFDDAPSEAQSKSKPSVPILRFSYPRKSVLSRFEMDKYSKSEKTFRSIQSISELQPAQYKAYKDFKALQTKVLAEQEEYQRFLMNVASQRLSEYNNVSLQANKYFEERMMKSVSRVKKYKQFYVHQRDFGIVFVPFKSDHIPNPIGNFSKTLGFKKQLSTVSSKTKIPEYIEPQREILPDPFQYWRKCLISEDINAQRLAIAWNADIAIGLSAMQTLADNLPPYQIEWEIPVLVQTYEGLAYDKKHKIAFIDKPLPPKCITPREKNHIYLKETFKHLSNATTPQTISVAKDELNETIPQLDGANDDSDGITGASSRTALSSWTRFKDNTTETQSSCGAMLQVDGANDESDELNKDASLKNVSTGANSENSETLARNKWLNPQRTLKSVSKDSQTAAGSSNSLTPFSSRKSLRSWTTTEAGDKSTNVTMSSDAYDKSKQTECSPAKDFSAELSFGLLPDSAISVATNSTATQPKLPTRQQKVEIKPPKHGVATRRSSRNLSATQEPKASETKKVEIPSKHNAKVNNKSQSKSRAKSRATPVSEAQKDSSSESEPIPASRTKRQRKKPNRALKISDSEDQNLPMPEVSVNNPKPSIASSDTKMSESDVLGQILGVGAKSSPSIQDVTSAWASQAKSMPFSESDVCYAEDDISLQQPGKDENVTYSLWKFGNKRVLVRHTIHGTLVIPKLGKTEQMLFDIDESKQSEVSLRTKLEYQSDYAYESLTQSELCRDWVTMLFKRPSKIVRARVDPFKNEILDVEWTMTLNHLYDKAGKVGYNSSVTAKLLIKTFDMIASLEKGEYICTHRENEQKMSVRKAVDEVGKSVVYDLYKEYSNPGRSVMYTGAAPWIPGDPHKLRKLHAIHRLIPLMFDPRDDAGGKGGSRKGKKK